MKELTLTATIEGLLKKAVGPDVNLGNLAVFEATLLTSLPIRQRHPLFEGAVAMPSMMTEAARQVTGESVPLHIEHRNTEAHDLNVGRLFHAQLESGPDGLEMRGLFFLSRDSEHVKRINEGVVDQVSINILSRQANCSKCGWDYFGEDATFDNIFGSECANGHVLGEDGAFVRLEGSEMFNELSLVSMGGAQKARIHGPTDSIFSENVRALATNIGVAPTALMLSATPTPSEEKPVMSDENKSTLDQLVGVKVELAQTGANLDLTKTHLETANTKLTAMTGERDTLQAQLETMTGERDALKTDSEVTETALGLMKEIGAALGTMTNATPPEDPKELLSFVTEHKTQLAGAIVVGGVSQPGSGASPKDTSGNLASFNAFKSSRK